MKQLAMKCFFLPISIGLLWFYLPWPRFFTILVNLSSILSSINENMNIIVAPLPTNA